MNNISKVAAAAVMAVVASSAAHAAMAPKLVKVSLLGEADQPMSIKVDSATVKAGKIEFDVTNDAIGTDHEVVLVKLKDKTQKIVSDMKKHRIDESKLKSMGEVAGLKPGDKGKLTVKLAAGDYMLLCNHKTHYEFGMETPFTVTN